VSLGNRADVSSNDLLRYWAGDPRTRVIALYLESFGNPRAFAEAAREASELKPVVVLKAGRSAAGGRATASHTGALVEGSQALTDALFDDAGVVRVDTVGELLDVAGILAHGEAPVNHGVGILTNAGGAGIACADACDAAGLRVPSLARPTRAALHRDRPQAATGYPVDLVADATAADFATALATLARDRAVDAVIVLHVPPLGGRDDDPLAAVAERAQRSGVPVLAVPLAQDRPEGLAGHLPVLDTPEEAAAALGRAVTWWERRARPADPLRRPAGLDRTAAAAAVAEGMARGGGWLAPDLTWRLARAYGLPVAASTLVTSVRGVAEAARRAAGPVVVKAVADRLVHKTEHGAVRLDLRSPTAAARAAGAMRRELRAAGLTVRGYVVQPMVPPGVELLIGALAHPAFGPVVACGAGGTEAELLADVQVRLAPVGPRTAGEMLRALRCFPLLDGWRGMARADVAAVEECIVRTAALAADRPEIRELECNPLVVGADGALAVDLRVRLADPRAGDGA
jgi:acyl-CoA synthetase (NDP forming)